MTDTSLRTEIRLKFPLEIKAGGTTARRETIALSRPKTRHAKQLAILLGADLARHLVGGGEAPDGEADSKTVGMKVMSDLLSSDRLDALLAIVADLCGEEASVIEDLDLEDLWQLGQAFLDFFPSLKSFLFERDQQNSPSSIAGGQPT